MKRIGLCFALGVFWLTGCGDEEADADEPPVRLINPDNSNEPVEPSESTGGRGVRRDADDAEDWGPGCMQVGGQGGGPPQFVADYGGLGGVVDCVPTAI